MPQNNIFELEVTKYLAHSQIPIASLKTCILFPYKFGPLKTCSECKTLLSTKKERRHCAKVVFYSVHSFSFHALSYFCTFNLSYAVLFLATLKFSYPLGLYEMFGGFFFSSVSKKKKRCKWKPTVDSIQNSSTY